MRTIDPILKNCLADQQGELILRVNTWTDAAAYAAAPAVPENIWECTAFDIFSTSATATLVTENDYILAAFSVFVIQRGVIYLGIEYTVDSGLFHVRKYKEDFGRVYIEGSSYPFMKVSLPAGDDTYENVITAFCTAIGKTAVFKNPTDPWLDYQFLPDGKAVSMNKAELFENLLKQKYTILVYEESPNELVFYNQDSFEYSALKSVCWSPALGMFAGVSNDGTNRVRISTDGIIWEPQASPELNSYISVCWSPELALFCAVSEDGTNRVMTSPDGLVWTAQAASVVCNWRSIAWSPDLGLFCAVGTNGVNRCMTSPNGADWTTRVEAEANNWASVCWSPALGLFVAVAQSGTHRVMTSVNGIDWLAVHAAEDSLWSSVCWSPELGLFCAVSESGTHRVMLSTDGAAWTGYHSASDIPWLAVTWSPDLALFVAVAYNGTSRIMHSIDGETWVSAVSPQQNQWCSVVWSPALNKFCVVAKTGTSRVMLSADGSVWTLVSTTTDWSLAYTDGPTSYLVRDQATVHYFWKDEAETLHNSGDLTMPQWNLGYLESTDDPPTTRQDAFYKIFLLKAPVRLDITDGDKIHFEPYWSIDPSKVIDAMMTVSEHLDLSKSPSWYQEIKSIIMFNSTTGGALPGTIERIAAYTPLVTAGFDAVLTEADNNLQAAMGTLDDHTHLIVQACAPAAAIPGVYFVFDTVGETFYVWEISTATWHPISGGAPVTYSYFILEHGDYFLIEDGSHLILY